MEAFFQDLRYTVRYLLKSPVFTLAIVSSLALGIGLNTVVFSFVNAFLLNPLPAVQDVDRIVAIYSQSKQQGSYYLPVSFDNYKDIQRYNKTFSQIDAYQMIRVGLSGETEAEQVVGEMVTANYFGVLGITAAKGRTFLPEEDAIPGAHPVVVLSDGLWRRRFEGDPKIVGKKVLLNGQPFLVIGVAPDSFKGMNSIVAAELWVPTMMYRTVYSFPEMFEQRSGQTLQLIGRLRPGTEIVAAAADLAAIADHLRKEFPQDNQGQDLILFPLAEAAVSPNQRTDFARSGTFLMMVAGLLLLIACVNVANLLFARGVVRSRELAVRMAVGADRRRLTRQMLTESLVLAMLGAICGLLVATVSRSVLWKLRPPYFAIPEPELAQDPKVLGFAGLLAIATGLAFGLLPVIAAAKPDLASTLRDSELRLRARRSKISAGTLLIFAQVFLCTLFISCAGIFINSLYNARRIDPGFDTSRILTLSFDLRSLGYDETRGRAFQQRLVERARTLPGVLSADLAENRILAGFRLWRSAALEANAEEKDRTVAGSSIVGTDYFKTVGIPILQGRGFEDRDRQQIRPVIIVNETMARKLWPGRSPVGERLYLDEETEPAEIVGIVRDSKYQALSEEARPFVYLPLLQRYSARATLHVRTQGDPETLLQPVRRAAQELDRALPLTDVMTVAEVMDRSLWMPRVSAILLSLFGGLALLLAVLGVYGVTAHAVNRRSLELGIRMALGAPRASVVRLLVGQCMTGVGLGILVGLVTAVAVKSWIATLLYRQGVQDTSLFFVVAILLVGVGFVASALPTLRATRCLADALRRG